MGPGRLRGADLQLPRLALAPPHLSSPLGGHARLAWGPVRLFQGHQRPAQR